MTRVLLDAEGASAVTLESMMACHLLPQETLDEVDVSQDVKLPRRVQTLTCKRAQLEPAKHHVAEQPGDSESRSRGLLQTLRLTMYSQELARRRAVEHQQTLTPQGTCRAA